MDAETKRYIDAVIAQLEKKLIAMIRKSITENKEKK